MQKPTRVAVVYTGMPASLVQTVEAEIRAALPGAPLTILSLSDPSIIDDAVRNGGPSPEAARRLAGMYMSAVQQGADLVLNGCSSVGDIADAAKPLFQAIGVPFVRIDERMARTAVRSHSRIGVLATLASTLEPTKRLIRRVAREEGVEVEIVDALADGAFGVPPERLREMLTEVTVSLADLADCFLLAQASMASSECAIAEATGKPAYASPRFGAADIAEILNARL